VDGIGFMPLAMDLFGLAEIVAALPSRSSLLRGDGAQHAEPQLYRARRTIRWLSLN
jgi:hypothetical protein